MNENDNKKAPQALPDEALEKVAGGMKMGSPEGFIKYRPYALAFDSRNNCDNCSNYYEENCPRLDIDYEGFYNMFGGDPNAMCQYYRA